MNKYKSDDYKLGAVKYYLKLQRVLITKLYAGMKRPNFELLFVSTLLCKLKCPKV
jgi:hypothetical protein